jgi:murein hydrolase activator
MTGRQIWIFNFMPYNIDRWRKTRIAIVLAAVLLTCGGAVAATEVGTILVSNLNMREGPGSEYRAVLQLARATQVRVLERQNGWLKIDHRGVIGYIAHDERYVRLMTIGAGSVSADDPRPKIDEKKLIELRAKADTLQERLKLSQTQIRTISGQEQELINAFNASEQALDKARRQVRETLSAQGILDTKIKELNEESAVLEKEIRIGEAYAAKRLIALYKLNQVGRIHLMASAESFFDFINRKSALERILSQDEAMLQALRDKQATQAALRAQLETGKAEQEAMNESLLQRIAQLGAEQHNRSALLNKIRGAKELEQAALTALDQAARELDTAMQALSPPQRPTRTAAPAKAKTANGSFGQYKGLLNWPVTGKIVSFFGPYRDEKSNLINFQSGINIQAERGEPIRAVSDGYTIYSSWFKGLGNMMIIDHGDHYYTVYAHLEEIFKVKGDRVEKGEVIATVGDSGSFMGPALHFQVRHHGTPVDPLEWINKG